MRAIGSVRKGGDLHGSCFLLWHTLRVAVRTLDVVYVVATAGRLECGVHGLDVDAAVRQLRMTRRARGARGLSMLFVTGETAKAFVDSGGRAVIAGADLRVCGRSVALVAERLALVRTDFHEASAIVHLRQRKASERNVILFAAIEERERRSRDFLAWAGIIRLRHWRKGQGLAVPVHLMTCEAWHRGLMRECRVEQIPRSLAVQWRDQVADAALEVHRVAAEAVVHQERLPVVILAEENLRIGCAVWPGRPARIFFAVTLGTAFLDRENVVCFQADLLRDPAAQVRHQLSQIL